jgi:hypothetical protein
LYDVVLFPLFWATVVVHLWDRRSEQLIHNLGKHVANPQSELAKDDNGADWHEKQGEYNADDNNRGVVAF